MVTGVVLVAKARLARFMIWHPLPQLPITIDDICFADLIWSTSVRNVNVLITMRSDWNWPVPVDLLTILRRVSAFRL